MIAKPPRAQLRPKPPFCCQSVKCNPPPMYWMQYHIEQWSVLNSQGIFWHCWSKDCLICLRIYLWCIITSFKTVCCDGLQCVSQIYPKITLIIPSLRSHLHHSLILLFHDLSSSWRFQIKIIHNVLHKMFCWAFYCEPLNSFLWRKLPFDSHHVAYRTTWHRRKSTISAAWWSDEYRTLPLVVLHKKKSNV